MKYSFILYNSLQRIFNSAPSLFEFDDELDENVDLNIKKVQDSHVSEFIEDEIEESRETN